MQFLFLPTNRWVRWGGSEVLWSQVAARLSAAGHRVVAAVPPLQEAGPHVPKLRAAGVEVRVATDADLWGSRGLTARIRRKLHSPYRPDWLTSADLAVISQAHTYDGTDWAQVLRQAGRPYVLLSQAASEHLQPGDDESGQIAAAHRRAVATLFVSQANLDLVRRQLGEALPNGAVVRNPVQIDPATGPLPWPTGKEVRLACVARLDVFAKGQDLLLDVLARDSWRQRPISLTFFGSGSNEHLIARRIEQLKLTNLSIAGQRRDVAAIWREHHGLLLGSRFEGLPLVLAEAMLLGRVPVVTDIAGNRELVTDNETGFLAPAPTADLIDEALERAWQRRGDWELIGHAAARAARERLPADPVGDFVQRLESLAC